MSEYQLTATDVVIRTKDRHTYQTIQLTVIVLSTRWLAAGGVPDPYVPPPEVPPEVSTDTQLFYDHENRLRVLEGQPPLTLEDVVNYLKTKQQPAT